MKDILGSVTANIKGGWRSTLVGAIFICAFGYEYFTCEKIELVSIDSALLALGISLVFAPEGKKIEEKKEE